MKPANFPWNKFPWQKSTIHFTRILGYMHVKNIAAARSALAKLNRLHNTLQKHQRFYKSNQVSIQLKSGEAWINFATGNPTDALHLMKTAADMEDSTSKHPVTPGEVLPARELYADMLLQMKQHENALQAYEAVLQKSPNRFKSLPGAGFSADKSGNLEKPIFYYYEILAIADSANAQRPELFIAK